MIFLSAQPDDFFFTWQLEILINNLNDLGVSCENIHVLIGYNEKRGVELHFRHFGEKYKGKALFFYYPDTRKSKSYIPSIRPHIISKHFSTFQYLKTLDIFYHDADLIFRELPSFEKLLNDAKWYVSDTKDYTDSNYLKSRGNGLFEKM
jgi:hypothetical protein